MCYSESERREEAKRRLEKRLEKSHEGCIRSNKHQHGTLDNNNSAIEKAHEIPLSVGAGTEDELCEGVRVDCWV